MPPGMLRLAGEMNGKSYPLKCRIQAAAKEGGATRVDIYDDIGGGDGFFGPAGVSAQDFSNKLKDIKGDLDVHINSAGGDVFEGIAISNAISGHRGMVTTVVDGLAASIASIIAQAGRKRLMRAGSMMMIHDAFGGCIGNAKEMQSMASTLDKISDNLADIYAKRSKKGTQADWRNDMREEKWYTAEEAVAAGLCDGIEEDAAQMPANLDIAFFGRVPDRIAARLVAMPKPRSAVNKALAIHHTSTVDTRWDGGKAKKNFPNKASVLEYCNAWFDTSDESDGAEDKKNNYKFPHHMTNGGPANLAACRNGLARLSGSKIPESDKTGVEAHLRAHLKDAGADDAENHIDYFVNKFGKGGRLSIVDSLPKIDVDTAKWNPVKAMRRGAKSENPEAYFRAICAGRRAGDPSLASSWALPYRSAPGADPNADAVLAALATLPTIKDLSNGPQAREFLLDLARQIDPSFDEEEIDGRLLAAMFTQGLKGA